MSNEIEDARVKLQRLVRETRRAAENLVRLEQLELQRTPATLDVSAIQDCGDLEQIIGFFSALPVSVIEAAGEQGPFQVPLLGLYGYVSAENGTRMYRWIPNSESLKK
jgi:hypothetical protein